MFCMLASENRRHWARGLALAFLGMTGTVLAVIWHIRLERSDYREEFAAAAKERAAEIETLYRIEVTRQQDIGALFASSRRVDAGEFRAFVQQTRESLPPASSSLAFVVALPQTQRNAFERALAKDYGPAYGTLREISPEGNERPAGERAHYYPIRFAEPADFVHSGPGLDVSSRPESAEALARAAATGRAALVGSTADGADDTDHTFRLFTPIYRGGKVPEGIEDRQRHLLGFSCGVYRYGTMLEQILVHATRFGQHVYVFDSESPDAPPVYVHESRSGTTDPSYRVRQDAAADPYAVEHRVALADRSIVLVFGPSRPMTLQSFIDPRAYALAAVGVLLSASFGWLGYRTSRARHSRLAAEERLRLAASVFHHAHEGILIGDADMKIIDVNRTFTDITGYAKEEVLGRSPRLLQSGLHDRHFFQDLWQILLKAGFWRGELWNRRKDGSLFAAQATISTVKDSQGRVRHYIGLFSDVTDRKRQQEELQHLAFHDALTDLPNRALIRDRVGQGLARAKRQRTRVAVCYLDLDQFKPVNDLHGHEAGDRLLCAIGERLRAAVREHDTVGRLGGDEFVLVLTDLKSAAECDAILQRLMGVVSRSYTLPDGAAIQVRMSIGATLSPPDDANADILLRHADQAMYRAKNSGRDRIQWFVAAVPG